MDWQSNKSLRYFPFFNSLPRKPLFLCVCSTSLLKTMWKNETLLVISPFPTAFSTLFTNCTPLSSCREMLSTNSFSYQESKICHLGKGQLFTNDKILDYFKLKAFADNKLNVAKMMISPCDRAENIVKKGQNTGYQHFLLFPQCFQKASSKGSLKVRNVW